MPAGCLCSSTRRRSKGETRRVTPQDDLEDAQQAQPLVATPPRRPARPRPRKGFLRGTSSHGSGAGAGAGEACALAPGEEDEEDEEEDQCTARLISRPPGSRYWGMLLMAGGYGLVVDKLVPGLPAMQSGLRVGDVITHINSVVVDVAAHLFSDGPHAGKHPQIVALEQSTASDVTVHVAPPCIRDLCAPAPDPVWVPGSGGVSRPAAPRDDADGPAGPPGGTAQPYAGGAAAGVLHQPAQADELPMGWTMQPSPAPESWDPLETNFTF